MTDWSRGLDYTAMRDRIERELGGLAEFHPLTTSNPAVPPVQPALVGGAEPYPWGCMGDPDCGCGCDPDTCGECGRSRTAAGLWPPRPATKEVIFWAGGRFMTAAEYDALRAGPDEDDEPNIERGTE